MAAIKENLIAARALIEKPENWLKGNYCNDEKTCFCALGAVAKAKGIFAWQAKTSEEGKLLKQLAGISEESNNSVAVFNDDDLTSHADVIALFDKAIELQQN